MPTYGHPIKLALQCPFRLGIYDWVVFGFLFGSFVAKPLGWKYVIWALLATCGIIWIAMIVALKETRHATILRNRATDQLRCRGHQDIYHGKGHALEHRP